MQAATDEEEEDDEETEGVVDVVKAHPLFESNCNAIFGGLETAFKKYGCMQCLRCMCLCSLRSRIRFDAGDLQEGIPITCMRPQCV